jgi:preprotein translocase subunit SecF
MEILKNKTNINFVGMRYKAGLLSVILLLSSVLLFTVRGPTWGIDFTGGTEIHIKFESPTEISDIRSALSTRGLSNDAVQQIGSPEDQEFVIRIQPAGGNDKKDATFGTEGLKGEVEGLLAKRFGADWIQEASFDAQIGARMVIAYSGPKVLIRDIQESLNGVEGAVVQDAPDDNTFYVRLPGLVSKIESSIRESLGERKFSILQTDSVGPKVGGELRRQGFVAILSTLALILLYVAIRFNIAFAPGAVLALFHDVTIVVGVFIFLDILGWTHEFNLPMIGALLTIIGYSLNDTIVIYDRIRENQPKYARDKTKDLINNSLNETLSRTLATSWTTMTAMAAFLLLGGPVIQTFALAIFLGVIVGTYSTVFVASPTILVMQDLRPLLGRLFTPLSEQQKEESIDEASTEAEKRRIEKRIREQQARQNT